MKIPARSRLRFAVRGTTTGFGNERLRSDASTPKRVAANRNYVNGYLIVRWRDCRSRIRRAEDGRGSRCKVIRNYIGANAGFLMLPAVAGPDEDCSSADCAPEFDVGRLIADHESLRGIKAKIRTCLPCKQRLWLPAFTAV